MTSREFEASGERSAAVEHNSGTLITGDNATVHVGAAGGRPQKPQASFSLSPPVSLLRGQVRGRGALLAELRELLTDPRPKLQVLHGLGGCGKTTVALSLAKTALDLACRVFWVSAAGSDRFLNSMKELARRLGASEEEIAAAWAPDATTPDLVWRYLDACDDPWLLVVDEADDPSVLAVDGGAAGDGTGWVRPSRAGLTVVTSRVADPEIWQAARCLRVGVLGPDDAADVLVDLAPAAGDRAQARALAERLHGLPLALQAAGSYLASTGAVGLLRRPVAPVRTFADYVEALGRDSTAILDGRRGARDDVKSERLHRQLVNHTWEMTLDLLEGQGVPEARTLLRLLSCFDSAPMPAHVLDVAPLVAHGLVAPDCTVERLEHVLTVLLSHNMVDIVSHGSEQCLSVHGLVLEVSADLLRREPPAIRQRYWNTAILLLQAASEPAPEAAANWNWWRLVAPHVLSLLQRCTVKDVRSLETALACGLRAYAYVNFARQPGDEVFADLLHKRSMGLGNAHPLRLSIRHRRAMGMPQERARKEYRQIHAAQCRLLGEEHPETLITAHQIADSLEDREEAEAQLKRVLDIRQRTLGPDDPYTLATLDVWAMALVAVERLEEGEARLRECLERSRRVFGPDVEWTIGCQSRLARLMRRRGHQEEADAEVEDMIQHSGRVGSRFFSLEDRWEIARVHDKNGRFAEAEQEYRAILADMDTLDNAFARGVQVVLAKLLRRQERHVEALELFDAVLASLPALAADDHWLLELRHLRGDELRYLERHAEAETEISEVLAIRRTTAADNDSVVLSERHCLAHALEGQSKCKEAETELRAVASGFRSVLGHGEQVSSAEFCLARHLFRHRKLPEAATIFAAVQQFDLATKGAADSGTLMARFWLARTRNESGLCPDDETELEYENILLGLVDAAAGDKLIDGVRRELDEIRSRGHR
ncbi:tetratricopeptide repeat protein [Nonomuraea sp. NBC_01738]|uniref:tetratricopeptide repeat protein n=1 Tax=Nonomuraea sp. NBC_01738 TaxID=2976003 RepID=UPI002E0DA48B|nr:tetratricopeptide repeat protein [Nonomuraea sp. NBC_01738]